MMKLHKRYQTVKRAELDLRELVLSWEADTDLTYLEILHCLQSVTSNYLKYALRAERHPEDPTRKADEE